MQRVDRPTIDPAKCAVLLKTDDPVGWIDTGIDLTGFDPHVYVSHGAVREMARLFGYLTPEESVALMTERDELAARVGELELELEEKSSEVAAVYTLKNAGFVQGAKPGRKVKVA